MTANYNAIPAVNWSSLKHLARSPLHYRHRLGAPEPDKAAYALGRAVHCAVLEPEQYGTRYAPPWETMDRRTTAGKASWAAYEAALGGREPLTAAIAATADGCAAAVYAHPVARELLRGGEAEVPLTWTRDGLACKGRLDYLRPDLLVDLKTSDPRDLTPRRFRSAAAGYLYHGQLAWYHDGAIAAGRLPADAPPARIVVVETDPPHDVACYYLDPADLAIGRALVARLLRIYADCTAADWWPGCAPDLLPLQLPGWAPGGDAATEEP